MELRDIVKILTRWWYLGAIPVLVVTLALVIAYQSPGTAYQVVLRFTTGGEPADHLSPDYDRYYAWLSSEYVANGLADLAVTSRFAAAVAERLSRDGIEVTSQAVQGSIVTDNAQSVMVLYVTWHEPTEAVAIAQAVGTELMEKGPDYYPQMDGLGSIARLADEPVAVPLPPSLRAQLLGPALRIALALAVGLGLTLIAHYTDPWIRDADELESMELPIVGIVPRARKARFTK